MKFKKLEFEPQGSWFSRFKSSGQLKKTFWYGLIGFVVGAVFYVVSEADSINNIETGELLQSSLMFLAYGIFIANSPCSRGKC